MKRFYFTLVSVLLMSAFTFSQMAESQMKSLKLSCSSFNEAGNYNRAGDPAYSNDFYYSRNSVSVFDTTNEAAAEIPPQSKLAGQKNYDGFYLAVGYGNSFGGLGIRAQMRVGGIVGVGVHAGFGYFIGIANLSGDNSSNLKVVGATIYSFGAKFFFYKSWYLNAQYGTFGYGEATKTVTQSYSSGYYSYYRTITTTESAYFKGVSVLFGTDMIFGKHFGFNAALGVSHNDNHNEYFQEYYLASDVGFVVRF